MLESKLDDNKPKNSLKDLVVSSEMGMAVGLILELLFPSPSNIALGSILISSSSAGIGTYLANMHFKRESGLDMVFCAYVGCVVGESLVYVSRTYLQ